MRIRRLGWAGVEIESGGRRLAIDPIEEIPENPWMSGAGASLPAASGPVDAVLLTHLHFDHADPAAIARVLAPGGVVLAPPAAEGEFLETAAVHTNEQALAGMNSRTLSPWDRQSIGPFEVTALPAVDGMGDPQVSWLVEVEGTRIVHCGDTLFHGAWWIIAMRHGPIDVAFLPINGAAVDYPHRQPASPLPAVMDPEQAAVAAAALAAAEAIPMHYGLNSPPAYREVEDALARFLAAAEEQGVTTRVLAPGEALS